MIVELVGSEDLFAQGNELSLVVATAFGLGILFSFAFVARSASVVQWAGLHGGYLAVIAAYMMIGDQRSVGEAFYFANGSAVLFGILGMVLSLANLRSREIKVAKSGEGEQLETRSDGQKTSRKFSRAA